jgi:hypothetical protein
MVTSLQRRTPAQAGCTRRRRRKVEETVAMAVIFEIAATAAFSGFHGKRLSQKSVFVKTAATAVILKIAATPAFSSCHGKQFLLKSIILKLVAVTAPFLCCHGDAFG